MAAVEFDHRRVVHAGWRLIMAAWLAIGLLSGGACHKAPPPPTANRKTPDTSPAFEPQKFVSKPNDGVRAELVAKPGHWSALDLQVVANRADAYGDLTSSVLDAGGTPATLGLTPFTAEFVRSAALGRKQLRHLEASVFCPPYATARQALTRMHDQQHRELFSARGNLALMPPQQWFFVVLAREPDRYRYLLDLDSITAPKGDLVADERSLHYRVRLMQPGKRLELGPSIQSWTSTAYVLWDDREPADLTPQQQQAMLDWLHWGGQLIISGPETLATLRGSFLEPFLPASAGAAIELGRDALAAVAGVTPYEPPSSRRPIAGIELKLMPGALAVSELQPRPFVRVELFDERLPAAARNALVQRYDGSPLMAERRVGRGRIAVTAVALTDQKLREWSGYDAFFNACLLRRVPRKFSTDGFTVAVNWADGQQDALLTSARNSQVRFLTRGYRKQALLAATTAQPDSMYEPPALDTSNPGSDVAAWEDSSSISDAARDALRDAAGITVPPSSFILRVLALYLAVLVPLNWLVFRVVGRVELAFAAVPVIAIIATVGVVWSAQLNIGFSRAHSEVGVIELQPDYARAHLTRYTAIYSSLGAGYRLKFEEPSAVALPFFTGTQVLSGQHVDRVALRQLSAASESDQPERVSLEGFQVASNSTGMVHSEQMLPMAGGIRLTRSPTGGYEISNESPWPILHAAIVTQTSTVPLGTLKAGEFRLASMRAHGEVDHRAYLDTVGAVNGLNLRGLLATAVGNVGRNETCVVGVVAQELPGLEIEPATVPAHAATVVLAHLDYGPLGDIKSDANQRPRSEPVREE